MNDHNHAEYNPEHEHEHNTQDESISKNQPETTPIQEENDAFQRFNNSLRELNESMRRNLERYKKCINCDSRVSKPWHQFCSECFLAKNSIRM